MTIKTKFTAILIVLIAFLSSCQKDDYMNSFTQDYTVYKKDWKVGTDDDSGDYFYYEFKEPNLTQDVYRNGSMQAFLLMNGDNITPLPFDDFWILDNGQMRTEQVTCEFRPGYVTFILKYNTHELDDPYYDYTFRVRFLW